MTKRVARWSAMAMILSGFVAADIVRAAVIVEAVDVAGGDFSNISNMPTDLQAEIDHLQNEDTVFGGVDVTLGDPLDLFSFLLTGTGQQSIPYFISGYDAGNGGGTPRVIVGDQFGSLLFQEPITENGAGLMTFNVNTGGSPLPFVIRFDAPDQGSFEYRAGIIPEPSSALLLAVAGVVILSRLRSRSLPRPTTP